MVAYIAIDSIKHNGADYDPGEDLDMPDFSEKELAALLTAGVIEAVSDDADDDETDADIVPRYAVAELAPLNYNGIDYAPGAALDDVEIAEQDLVQLLADGLIVAVVDDKPIPESGKAVSAKSKKKLAPVT